jgi:replicative DNA helicase
MNTEDLPLPDNLDCERLVLGALMSADPARTPVEAILTSLAITDFSIEKHKLIFRRMGEIHQRGGRIDRVTLAEELKRNRELASVDGLSYLVSLDDGLPHVHHIDNYISILREKAMLRKLICDVESIKSRAYRGESPGDLAEELRRVGEGMQPKGEKAFETADQIIERVGINDLIRPSQNGIEPPFAWLRSRMRFKRKTLTVLAANTGEGKTACAMQSIYSAAHAGKRTALYSMEMSNEEVLCRIIGQVGRVNMHRLSIGLGEEDERGKAHATAWKIAELGDMILYRDTGTITIPMLRQDLHRYRSIGKPIEFLVVDYLQLMSGIGRFGTRAEEVASLSRGMKQIAQDFDIPVMVLSQFSRPEKSGNTKNRKLTDLKESSGIEQDANHVIFLERVNDDDEADVQPFVIRLKKQRGGPKGHGNLIFTSRYARFDEVEERPVAA